MRKVIVSEFVSLDGVMEEPGWTFQFPSEDRDRYKFDELAAADALLLGRVTYEGFAAAWPGMARETGEYGAWMNGYPKHVVSSTLKEPLEWNNSTLIEGDLAEEVRKLKQRPGKDILVFGSADLVNALVEHDLVDEYRLMVFPVVVGKGKRLFADGLDTKAFRLVGSKTFESGAVVLTYRPAEAQTGGQAGEYFPPGEAAGDPRRVETSTRISPEWVRGAVRRGPITTRTSERGPEERLDIA